MHLGTVRAPVRKSTRYVEAARAGRRPPETCLGQSSRILPDYNDQWVSSKTKVPRRNHEKDIHDLNSLCHDSSNIYID